MDSAIGTRPEQPQDEPTLFKVCGYRNVPQAFRRFEVPGSHDWSSRRKPGLADALRARAMHALMQFRQQAHRGGGKNSWRFSS